ncbi:MAG: NirD/YgiW/YdeI family stress tolerance protein [Alphaproteobacteria bacterium]|nr:NirD/YgiW/YdeI family stress tolerance protein [Alphaproteobacteria bacterium]
MKKILLIISALFWTTLLSASDITTIDFIKNNAKDNAIFTVQGVLTKRLSEDKYMFKDSTGEMKIEIERSAMKEMGLTRMPINTKMTLQVKVDKEFIKDTKLEVFEITEIASATNDGKAISLDITSIADMLKAKDNQIFTIAGTIVKRVSENKYEIKDDSASTIIEIEKSAFRQANINRFNANDKVVLTVKVDKEFAERPEFEAFEIIKHNK